MPVARAPPAFHLISQNETRKIFCSRLMLWLGLFAITSTARAHDPGLSSATVVVGSEHIEATLVFSGVDAAIIAQQGTPAETKPDARQTAVKLKKLATAAIELRLDGQKS